jgi:hypothetical protein
MIMARETFNTLLNERNLLRQDGTPLRWRDISGAVKEFLTARTNAQKNAAMDKLWAIINAAQKPK